MTPDLLAQLAVALGGATASGLRVYGTVAALGWLQHFAVIHLPPGLEVLGNPIVLGVATTLYVAEFIADKIPAFDSFWDAIHTFVRIPAAALLGFAALGDASEPWRAVAALLCGGIALSVHGIKSGTRLAVNTSPEPFSNWGLSFGEEISVAGLLYLVVAHPIASIGVALAALLCGALAMFWIGRSIARLFRRSANQSSAA